jgi:putative lumazine-binding protein
MEDRRFVCLWANAVSANTMALEVPELSEALATVARVKETAFRGRMDRAWQQSSLCQYHFILQYKRRKAMTAIPDIDLVRELIERYIEGTRTGDLRLVEQTFHPDARMSGVLQGKLLVGTPQPFFDAVANAPAPMKSGEPYAAKISHLHVAGQAATATLEEGPYLGMHFTNYFHFLKIAGEWRIIGKTFSHA